jgi:hypothetical protein
MPITKMCRYKIECANCAAEVIIEIPKVLEARHNLPEGWNWRTNQWDSYYFDTYCPKCNEP